MSDNLGLFDRKDDDTGSVDLAELRAALARNANDPPPPPVPKPAARREARARREAILRRRKRRRRHTVVAVVVLLVLAGAITTGFFAWRKHSDAVPDFAGPAGPQTIIRIGSSDSRDDIATSMQQAGVVASSTAFLNATTNDAAMQKIQPGYYRLQTHISAQVAATQLVDPTSRQGQVDLKPGRQLADVSTKSGGGGAVTPGYITAITDAACVPLTGKQVHCFTADDLWKVAETADPESLGIVAWAMDGVENAPDPRRRLEGMIVPGEVDVPPDSTALQALTAVVSASAAAWSTSGIVTSAAADGITPYQAVVIASLVERESNTADMPKVSRVITNRLAQKMMLQLDSTVNYGLNRAQVSTTATERADPTSPYNTYAHVGLPPTPISSPGDDAVDAAVQPAPGNWLFFVQIDKAGNSCFSTTLAQHNTCVDQARKNGVFGG